MPRRESGIYSDVRLRRGDKPFQPVERLIKTIIGLGLTLPEVAAVLDCLVEHLVDVLGLTAKLGPRQVEQLHALMPAVAWWNGYRADIEDATDPETLANIYEGAADVWDRLPRALIDDWDQASDSVG